MGVNGWLPKHLELDGLGWGTSTYHGLENALKEILDERDSSDPFLVILDYGSLYYSTQFCSIVGARNKQDAETARTEARTAVERKRREDAKIIRDTLGGDTRILEVHDGPLRPEAKRTTICKRWKRRNKEREKYGRMKCGRFADELMSGLGERSEADFVANDYILIADDEGDRALNRVLTARHELPDPDADVELPRSGELDVFQAERLVCRADPSSIVVIGRDTDEPAVNTARERKWSILVGWNNGVAYRRRGSPADKTWRKKSGPYSDTILLFAPGLDRLYTASRERRMKRSLLLGQDYSDRGLYGAGQKTIDSGRAKPLLDVDRGDLTVLQAAIACYFGSGTPVEAAAETAQKFNLALRTWAGERVAVFDIATFYAELDLDPDAPLRSPGLAWPTANQPDACPAKVDQHPLAPAKLSPRMPKDPTRAGQICPARSPRLRLRPLCKSESVLRGHQDTPPDKPRTPKTRQRKKAGDDDDDDTDEEQEEEEDEDEAETGEDEEEEADGRSSKSTKRAPGSFGTRARKPNFDYAPASTHRLKHGTWERSLVPECFIEQEEPPKGRRRRKRHLSGSAQRRKRRGWQPWQSRRQRQRPDELLEQALAQARELDDDEDEDVDMDSASNGVKGPELGMAAKLEGRRRGYPRGCPLGKKNSPSASSPPHSSSSSPPLKQVPEPPRLVRLRPFEHVLRLVDFCLKQSLPWLRSAYSAWAKSVSDPQASGLAQEGAIRSATLETKGRDGIARIGAMLAQAGSGREDAQEKARFATFRQAATAAGHPRPPNFRRQFFVTVLRPYDTAIHSESKRFIDDLGDLGKSLGADLVRGHDVLANFGLARTSGPLNPSLAQWLASSVPETHDLLGKTISRLLRKRPFRLLSANRGRAIPQLTTSFPANLQAQDRQRRPPLSDSVLTAIERLSPTTPQLVASLQRTIERILEFRDGLLSLIYETKNGQNVKPKSDGAKIKDLIAEEGLKEYMVGAQLLVRRMLGAQLLPNLHLEAFPFDADELSATLDHYDDLCTEAERLARSAIRDLAPALVPGAEKSRLAVAEPLLDLFETRNCASRSSRRAELKSAICSVKVVKVKCDGESYGQIVVPEPVELVVRRDESKAVAASVLKIKEIFGVGKKALVSLSKCGATSEFLNVICRTERLPRGFLPTGAMSVSPASISLFGCRTTVIRNNRAQFLEARGFDLIAISAGWLFERALSCTEERVFPRWSNLDPQGYAERFKNNLATEFSAEGSGLQERRVVTIIPYRNGTRPPDLPTAKLSQNPATPSFCPIRRIRPPVRRYIKPPRTSKGLPITWPDSDKTNGITRVREFAITNEHRSTAGIDIGKVELVTLFTSTPYAKDGTIAEGVALYGRRSLLELQKLSSREASSLLVQRQRVLLASTAPSTGSTGSTEPRSSIAIATLSSSSASSRHQQERSRLRSTAEQQGVTAELARHIVGGSASKEAKEGVGMAEQARAALVYVGKGSMVRTGGGQGPQSGAAITRQLEVELRRRRVRCLFVRTNEAYTSSVCPSAHCTDQEGQRNLVIAPKRTDGSTVGRLAFCAAENKMMHHDGVGAANIAISGEKQRLFGLPACPFADSVSTLPGSPSCTTSRAA